MRIFLILFICSALLSCKESEKKVGGRSMFRDSVIQAEHIDIDFDSVFTTNRQNFSIDFHSLDSGYTFISSNYSIFDIEKLDSVNFNIKLNLTDNEIQINLHTKDSTLVKTLLGIGKKGLLKNSNLNSILFSEYYILFNLYPKSFKSVQLAHDQVEFAKLVSGNGELINIIQDKTKTH